MFKASKKKTLESLANETADVLLSIKTVFPFTPFPDTLSIDLHVICFVRRDFFFHQNVFTVNHEDVLNVVVDTNLFFGSLTITTRFFSQNPLVITFLKKDEAIAAKRFIIALVTAHKNEVEIPRENLAETIKFLDALGKGKE